MIALVNVPNKYPFLNKPQIPLGIGYICSYLRSQDVDCELYDFDRFPVAIEKAVDLLLQKKPELIGFTCYSTNYFIVRAFCQRIKKKNPTIKTVIGGPTSTFAFKDILNDNSHLDFCVIGEGEYTLLDLYKNLNGEPDDLSKIKGLAFKTKDNIVQTDRRTAIPDLDLIPSPYLTEVFKVKYYDSVYVTSGRGCPMKCIFCIGDGLFGPSVRFHSPRRILEEIDYLHKNNKKMFVFSDDTLTISKKQIDSILDGLEERKYKMSWTAQTRIDRVSKELLIRMKNTGVLYIGFGLESADPNILKILQKVRVGGEGTEVEERHLQKFDQVFKWLKELNIQGVVSVIFGSPFETFEHAKKTIEYLIKIDREYGIKYAINVLVPLRGTNVFANHEKYNMQIQKDEEFLLPYRVKKYSALTVEEIIQLRKLLVNDNNLIAWKEIWNGSLGPLKIVGRKEAFNLSRDAYYNLKKLELA